MGVVVENVAEVLEVEVEVESAHGLVTSSLSKPQGLFSRKKLQCLTFSVQ